MGIKRENGLLRIALPKGHMQEDVFTLLKDAGIRISMGARNYRPTLSLPEFETKILKPQNIVEMVHLGSRDLGFTGEDWVRELGADVEQILDTGQNPVRIVAAAPRDILVDGKLPKKPLVVASEYERLTKEWILRNDINATFVRSYGATEVFPPEDADCIVDNTSTGSTLRNNNLQIVDELMTSTTRLFANPKSLRNPAKKEAIDRFVMLCQSVIEARKRVMIEVNVPAAQLAAVVEVLPCMRKPTISPLFGEDGFAVKAAVPKDMLPDLIPEIKKRGGTDVVVTAPDQLVS